MNRRFPSPSEKKTPNHDEIGLIITEISYFFHSFQGIHSPVEKKRWISAEKAEVLLPGGLFCQKCESSVENGLGLQQIVRGNGQKFMTRGEITDEIGIIAFQIVGIAQKNEFHGPYPM